MLEFFQYCLTFPVIIFSGLLVIFLLYWLIAAFGVFDFDSFDVDGGGDVGDMGDVGDPDGAITESFSGSAKSASELSNAGLLSSYLKFMGLRGVPLTLSMFFVSLFGWLITYILTYKFLTKEGSGFFQIIIGGVIFVAAFLLSSKLASFAIIPFKKIFTQKQVETGRSLQGKTVTVRTMKVTPNFGEAIYDNGAAGLILDVRAKKSETSVPLKQGDTAIIIDYDKDSNSYLIVSEKEFKGA